MTARRELRALWSGAQRVRERLEQEDAGGVTPVARPLRALGIELASATQRLETAGMLTDEHRARLDEAVSTLGKAAAGTMSPEAALKTYMGAIEVVALAYHVFLRPPAPSGGGAAGVRPRVISSASR